jgi:hypothetical protein
MSSSPRQSCTAGRLVPDVPSIKPFFLVSIHLRQSRWPSIRYALYGVIVLASLVHGTARAQSAPWPLPTFAEMEAAGARIGEIRIATKEIFDTADPKEDKLLFRWANALHIQTRPGVIERALLFKTGDLLSVRVLDETERLLRSNRYLYDVQFRPLAYHDGVVDIEVMTRDTWTLDPGVTAGRSGGANSGGIHLEEYNLLGTGMSISFGHSTNVDRTSNEFQFANDRAFGTWTSLSYSHATNSDGRRDAVAMVRPFYALDARWAGGVTASRDDRIESIYNAGNVVSQYRHRQKQAEVFGGWSAGLVDGWVQRYSLGVTLQDDVYAPEVGATSPSRLPADQKLVAPFVRYELIEDRYERELNRNLIGRPEFFALGFHSTIQLGWASTGFGSSRDAWLYSGSVSRGFEPAPDHTLIASAKLSGQVVDGQARRQRLGAQAQYYLRQGKRWLFYAGASADMLTRPDPADELLLGGDNGLRGYPLRYQSGTRRALFTVDERFYTDLYVWRLFRVGGAAFLDAGRAWGGDNINTVNPGWLSNAGVGLRIVSARSAFSNVLHVDIAFPLNATPDVKKVQLLVTTNTSF